MMSVKRDKFKVEASRSTSQNSKSDTNLPGKVGGSKSMTTIMLCWFSQNLTIRRRSRICSILVPKISDLK